MKDPIRITIRNRRLTKMPASSKSLRALETGKDAIRSWTKCEQALINQPADAGGSGSGNAAAGQTTAAPPKTGGPAPASSGPSLLTGRYVDDKGKPLADASQQPYGEFRMMPINLKVVIEQKEIPRLLAECANSAMRIDVRGVRFLEQEPPAITPTAADAATGAASAGGGEAAPRPSQGHASPMGGMGGMGGFGNGPGSDKSEV